MLEKTKKSVLGRGLASLIPYATEQDTLKATSNLPFIMCPVEMISVNSDQPRKAFSKEDFNRAVRLFHEINGCDPETGRPLPGKLMELDLEWVQEMLKESGIGT